jgi:hypothetical protein
VQHPGNPQRFPLTLIHHPRPRTGDSEGIPRYQSPNVVPVEPVPQLLFNNASLRQTPEVVSGAGKLCPSVKAALAEGLGTSNLRGRLELESAMRIGGARLLSFLLLYLALLNAYMAVSPNEDLFSVNFFLEQVCSMAFLTP